MCAVSWPSRWHRKFFHLSRCVADPVAVPAYRRTLPAGDTLGERGGPDLKKPSSAPHRDNAESRHRSYAPPLTRTRSALLGEKGSLFTQRDLCSTAARFSSLTMAAVRLTGLCFERDNPVSSRPSLAYLALNDGQTMLRSERMLVDGAQGGAGSRQRGRIEAGFSTSSASSKFNPNIVVPKVVRSVNARQVRSRVSTPTDS